MSPHNSRKITINGVEYPSIYEAERQLGFKTNSLHMRLLRGTPIDLPKREDVGKCKEVVWDGIWYPSIKAMAEALNIKYVTAAKRVASGKTKTSEVAPEGFVKGHADFGGGNKPITLDGVEYPSIKQAAKELGLSVGSMYSSRQKGKPINLKPRAFNQPCTVRGVTYPTLRIAAETLGVTRQRIHQILQQEKKRETKKENIAKGIEKRKITMADKPKKVVSQKVFNNGTEFEYKGKRYKIL